MKCYWKIIYIYIYIYCYKIFFENEMNNNIMYWVLKKKLSM